MPNYRRPDKKTKLSPVSVVLAVAVSVELANSAEDSAAGPGQSLRSTPAAVSQRTIRIDLRSHWVHGINLGRISIDEVRDAVGEKNAVESFVSHPVGDTSFAEFPACLVDFGGGHKLLIDDSQGVRRITIDDPIFRTDEGLGVGSEYAEFFPAYGRGEVEGDTVNYFVGATKRLVFQLVFDPSDTTRIGKKVALHPSAKVKKLILVI